MTTFKLKGREIPLLYMSEEMLRIQEEIGPLDQAIKTASGRNPDDDTDTSRFGSAEHLKTLAKMIKILGNAGLEEAGETPDLTEKAVLRAIKPNEIFQAVNDCINAMAEGMHSEIPEEKPVGPVDVTLEEINKKKEKAG